MSVILSMGGRYVQRGEYPRGEYVQKVDISEGGWGEYPVGGYVQGWIAPPPPLPPTHMGPGIPTPLPAIDT